MAYEGLFGIGDAGNLNNRDLEQEFRDRELHMQKVARFKEEQKKWEETRSKNRRENRDELYDNYFDKGEIHVNYQPYISGKIKEHHQWITENMDENGLIKDESLEEYRLREDKIIQDVTALKDRTTNYNATVDDMRKEGTNINLYKKAEDGTYLVDFNEGLFIKGLEEGRIVNGVPVDLASMKGTPEPRRGSETYITKQKTDKNGLLVKPDTRTTIENNVETTVSYYEPDRVDTIENNIYENLNPNELYHENGDVAKSEYIIDYMDESNQTRFFEENDTGGVDDPNVLNPQSEVYNEEIADQYARWLAKDLTKDLREEKIINQKYVKPKKSEKKEELTSILTQNDVDLYNNPQPSDTSYNGFVVAEGTDIPVTVNKHKATVPLRESDIYSTPNQGQVFLDENGQELMPQMIDGKEVSPWKQIAGSIDSSSGEGVSINGTLEATMQLENGDFVGLYSLEGSNYSVLVPFSKMNEGTFKVTGNEQPSEHLKQFEYWRMKNEQFPPKSDNASSFDKNKPGDTETSTTPFNPDEFEVSGKGVSVSKFPTVDGTIKLGPKKEEYTFENPLSQEDYETLWSFGVRKIVWDDKSPMQQDGQPSYSTWSNILTIPYRTHMDGKSKSDYNPGTMFTMDDILAIIKSKK
jgi:hypothetical protein